MATTNFVTGTIIGAEWLNEVDALVHDVFGGATTDATARTNLGLGSIATQAASAVAITGGTIDGATIATSDITVGAAKTLDVSAGTLTLADNQISGDKVDGGTISNFASTGIDDNAASTAITIDSSQQIGIGETVPLGLLHVKTADSAGSVSTGYDEFVIEGSANVGMTILSGTANVGGIAFADSGGTTQGTIRYEHNNDAFTFGTSNAERMRLDNSGNLGIGVTPSAWHTDRHSQQVEGAALTGTTAGTESFLSNNYYFDGTNNKYIVTGYAHLLWLDSSGNFSFRTAPSGTAGANMTLTERMRLDNSGQLLIAKTASDFGVAGHEFNPIGYAVHTRDGGPPVVVNRINNDGSLIEFQQDGTIEGTISVSGTTVSYLGAHLSRWSQTQAGDKPHILRGTVMSSISEMCQWGEEENEQLTKAEVSTTAGDKAVGGVFERWDEDGDDPYNDMIIAQTGDFVIRVTGPCQIGDLLESNGDGTARVQVDDVVRSSTVAKVMFGFPDALPDEENTVPCLLMIC